MPNEPIPAPHKHVWGRFGGYMTCLDCGMGITELLAAAEQRVVELTAAPEIEGHEHKYDYEPHCLICCNTLRVQRDAALERVKELEAERKQLSDFNRIWAAFFLKWQDYLPDESRLPESTIEITKAKLRAVVDAGMKVEPDVEA